MIGHQTARADIHLNPAAGFEELMELLRFISACVGGLSSPFYLPSVRLQGSNTHLGCADVCKITLTHTHTHGQLAHARPISYSFCHETGSFSMWHMQVGRNFQRKEICFDRF